MSQLDHLLAANDEFAADFDKGELEAPPTRKLAILTCMDARIDPARMLGLQAGEAHVIRNAGGRATPEAIHSLIVSQQILGTREVVVIHHTDCGMQGLEIESLRSQLERGFGADSSSIEFPPFPNVNESLRRDIRALRDHPFIPDDIEITGLIYDVRTGRLQRPS